MAKEKRVDDKQSVLRKKCKDVLAFFYYEAYLRGLIPGTHPIRVMSIDETIEEMRRTEKSLVRFGDGEIAMMRGVHLKLQSESDELVRRMKEIFAENPEGLLITVSDVFSGLSGYVPASRQFWRDHLLFCMKIYQGLCRKDVVYGNTFFSRPYMIFADKNRAAEHFEKIRQLWKDRKIIVVEGIKTHDGVGNDLFSGAASVERILCPPREAFRSYDKILQACLECPQDRLFLLSVGPTAKPLAADLHKNGRRAIDIGNLDMEYEWFLQKAQSKVPVAKHSIDTTGQNLEAGFDDYLNEVIRVITND